MSGVSNKQKYMHRVLVNPSVKLAQEKSVLRLTDRLDMTKAVDWDVKQQTKQANKRWHKYLPKLTLSYLMSGLVEKIFV